MTFLAFTEYLLAAATIAALAALLYYIASGPPWEE